MRKRLDLLETFRSSDAREAKNQSSAFTLIELCLAVGVLALIAVGLLSALLTSSKADSSMRERDIAIWGVRSQLEQVIGWPDYSTIPGTFNDMEFPIGDLEGLDGPDSFPGLVTVDDTNPNLLLVTVTANWSSVSGDDSVEVSTMISNPDVTVTIE